MTGHRLPVTAPELLHTEFAALAKLAPALASELWDELYAHVEKYTKLPDSGNPERPKLPERLAELNMERDRLLEEIYDLERDVTHLDERIALLDGTAKLKPEVKTQAAIVAAQLKQYLNYTSAIIPIDPEGAPNRG